MAAAVFELACEAGMARMLGKVCTFSWGSLGSGVAEVPLRGSIQGACAADTRNAWKSVHFLVMLIGQRAGGGSAEGTHWGAMSRGHKKCLEKSALSREAHWAAG